MQEFAQAAKRLCAFNEAHLDKHLHHGGEEAAPDRKIAAAVDALCKAFLGKPGGVAVVADLVPFLERVLLKDASDASPQALPMLSASEKSAMSETPTFSKQTQDQLVLLYARLMAVIKAVLVRLCVLQDTMMMPSLENGEHTFWREAARHVWHNVLGDLDSVRLVLVRAEELTLIQLGSYPRSWAEFIEEAVRHAHECIERMNQIEAARLALRQRLMDRRTAIANVRTQFDAPLHELQLLEGEFAWLQQSLKNASDVEGALGSYDSAPFARALRAGQPPPLSHP